MTRTSKLFAAAIAAFVLSAPAFAQDHGTAHGDHAAHQHPQGHEHGTILDPVCGMKIDPKKAAAKSVYAGKAYYFCSNEDKAKFEKDPEKYLKK
jgi:Cu+-exporting ATPase